MVRVKPGVSVKKLVGPADYGVMDPPGSEKERAKLKRRGRSLVIVAAVGFVALGMVGVTVSALVGRSSSRVVVSTKRATVATTVPTVTTPQATTVYVPPTTAQTTPPATSPPATNPPATSPPTRAASKTTATVAATARLLGNPSTAKFPSTPPPYWPMPIVHVTVTNTGGVTVRSVVVHPVGVYSVPSSSCTTLTPGQSCDAQVQFCPTSPGRYLNVLSVTGQNAISGTPLQASITLDGTAT